LLTWLIEIDDARLLSFGLFPDDIKTLREAAPTARLAIRADHF